MLRHPRSISFNNGHVVLSVDRGDDEFLVPVAGGKSYLHFKWLDAELTETKDGVRSINRFLLVGVVKSPRKIERRLSLVSLRCVLWDMNDVPEKYTPIDSIHPPQDVNRA